MPYFPIMELAFAAVILLTPLISTFSLHNLAQLLDSGTFFVAGSSRN